MKKLGLRGVEINPNVNGMDLTDPRLNLEKFFAKAQELDVRDLHAPDRLHRRASG